MGRILLKLHNCHFDLSGQHEREKSLLLVCFSMDWVKI